ncbi:hypothetical protein ACLB2K_053531 [Fragaria x ananassa]
MGGDTLLVSRLGSCGGSGGGFLLVAGSGWDLTMPAWFSLLSLVIEDGESINSTARFFIFALCTGQELTVVRLSATISIFVVRSSRASTGKEEKKDKAPRSVQGKESKAPGSLKGNGLLRRDALPSGFD